MYGVPQASLTLPAVANRLDRGVRPHRCAPSAARDCCLLATATAPPCFGRRLRGLAYRSAIAISVGAVARMVVFCSKAWESFAC
jgi:hypothetical protein